MRQRSFPQVIALFVFVTFSVVCLTPSPGFGQEFGLFIGKANNSISGPWSLRESSLFGGSFEAPVWYNVSFEQRLGYMSHFPEPTSESTRTGSILADSNLNLHLPFVIVGLRPYATAGVGFVRTLHGGPQIGTNLDVNYGGGVKFFIPSTPLGLRVDLRLHHIINVVEQKDVKTLEYSAGLLVRKRKG